MTVGNSCSRADSGRLSLHCGCDRRSALSFAAFTLVVSIRAWSRCKVTHRWETWLIVPRRLMQVRVRRYRCCISGCGSLTAQWKDVFGSRPRCYGFGLGGRLWQELLEVFQQIGGRFKQSGDLRVDFLDRFGLSLVRLEDLKELLVDVWLGSKAILHSSQYDRARNFYYFYLSNVCHLP